MASPSRRKGPRSLALAGDEVADTLLAQDPLALLIGMVLDQQIPLERAFKSPADLKERLGGTLDVGAVASMDPDELAALFSVRPALHRFPGSMARRVQELCHVVIDTYGGDAAAIWTSAQDGAQLLANVKALPGFGEQKARIFVALLGKQFAVRPPGWQEASSPFGEPGSFRSVADIDSREALGKVRQYKQQLKAEAKATAKAPPKAAPSSKVKAISKTKAKVKAVSKTKVKVKAASKARVTAPTKATAKASGNG
ncbi:MAG TPA: HhH-GPD-type base excision DNA repair protein [Acidimicrobiales bacterium]|nr:HhH-GPD-type base excision DNA repair protein [Acidimicrobiales bacterium]